MSFEKPDLPQNEEDSEHKPARAFIDLFQKDLKEFQSFLRKSKSVSAEELQSARELAKKANGLLSSFEDILTDEESKTEIKTDLASKDSRGAPSEWGTKTKEFDQIWKEIRGLMEEMRWEKQRLTRLQK